MICAANSTAERIFKELSGLFCKTRFVSCLVNKNVRASLHQRKHVCVHHSIRTLCLRTEDVQLEFGLDAETLRFRQIMRSKNKSIKQQKFSILNDDSLRETSYYFENGFRKVYPYICKYRTNCKQRWVGRTLLDVYSTEFRVYSSGRQDVLGDITSGQLTINGSPQSPDYVLQINDVLGNTLHRHETVVLDRPIKIVHSSDELVVVNKPSSISAHPCGKHRHNSMLFILAKERKMMDLKNIHRLDRLTSGLLIFARTAALAGKLSADFRGRNISKEYVARVEGEFPSGMVTCKAPLKVISTEIGLSVVNPSGRECVTKFLRLSYSAGSSVVLCLPETGRTHQIRVHLQYLGHPIINDPVYNSELFGPHKGKDGRIDKTPEQIISDYKVMHWWEDYEVGTKEKPTTEDINEIAELVSPVLQSVPAFPSPPLDPLSESGPALPSPPINPLGMKYHPRVLGHCAGPPKHPQTIPNAPSTSKRRPGFDPSKVTYNSHCYDCKVQFKDPDPGSLRLFLHALSYKGPGWGFETDMPDWAKDDWKDDGGS